MSRVINKTICDSCGMKIYQRSISIKNFHKYDTKNKDRFIHQLMQLEKVDKAVATSWAEHGLYEECN